MSDRRRATRFISAGAQGVLRLMQDVYVEHANAGEITVLAATRPAMREQTIQMRDKAGRRVALRVQPTTITVVSAGEVLRNRIVFRVVGFSAAGDQAAGEPLDGHAGRIGVLVRRIVARAVNVSSSGCLLDLPEYVAEGTVALLNMVGVQRGSGEAVRLCRPVHIIAAALPWRAGAEFLPLDAPLPTSVRNAAARLEALLDVASFVGDRPGSGERASGQVSDAVPTVD